MDDSEQTIDQCVLCHAMRPGRVHEFGYGDRSRGMNPRTLREDLPILGTERDFVCDSCERRSLVRAVLRATRYAIIVGAVAFLVQLALGLVPGDVSDYSRWAFWLLVASVAGAFIGAVLTQLHWRRTYRLEQELFEKYRPVLARQIGREPDAVHFYTSEQVENAAQQDEMRRPASCWALSPCLLADLTVLRSGGWPSHGSR